MVSHRSDLVQNEWYFQLILVINAVRLGVGSRETSEQHTLVGNRPETYQAWLSHILCSSRLRAGTDDYPQDQQTTAAIPITSLPFFLDVRTVVLL